MDIKKPVYKVAIIAALLLLLTGLTSCGSGEEIYYYRSGTDGDTLFKCEAGKTAQVDWNNDGDICGLAFDGEILCLMTQNVTEQSAEQSFKVYNADSKTWTTISGIDALPYYIEVYDGYIYYLHSETSDWTTTQVCRIKADGTGNEALPIYHSPLYDRISIYEDTVYTVTSTDRCLNSYSLSDLSVKSVQLPEADSSTFRLSGDGLYMLCGDGNGAMEILKHDPENSKDASFSEFFTSDSFNSKTYKFIDGKLVYSEDDGQYYIYSEEGSAALNWTWPEGYSPSASEYMYFASPYGFAAVFEEDGYSEVHTVYWDELLY